MITIKNGEDIVVGDKMLIVDGNTIPFSQPLQPMQVVDIVPYVGHRGQSFLICKKNVNNVMEQEHLIWHCEQYFVWVD